MITKTFSGFCPTQNKQYTISVDYMDFSTLDGRVHKKHLATCDFVKRGEKCEISKCPIIKSAPDRI